VPLAARTELTLNEYTLQPRGAFSHEGRAPLAGTLVKARYETRPGKEMTSGRKVPHVSANLGEENLGRGLAQAWDFLQSFNDLTKGLERGLDPPIDGRDSRPAAHLSSDAGR
jgi:hypothetical protein